LNSAVFGPAELEIPEKEMMMGLETEYLVESSVAGLKVGFNKIDCDFSDKELPQEVISKLINETLSKKNVFFILTN
jgi:hypothetical protein